MASDAEPQPCATCGGYGQTCVLTAGGLRLLLVCADCDGAGFVAQAESERSGDNAE